MAKPPRVSHPNQTFSTTLKDGESQQYSEFRARHLENQLHEPRYFQIDTVGNVTDPASQTFEAVSTTFATTQTFAAPTPVSVATNTSPAKLLQSGSVDLDDVRNKINEVIDCLSVNPINTLQTKLNVVIGNLGLLGNIKADLDKLKSSDDKLQNNIQLVATKLNELISKLDAAGLVDAD